MEYCTTANRGLVLLFVFATFLIQIQGQPRIITLPPFQPPQDCGTSSSNYRPCIEKELADEAFLACCQQYVPKNCHSICQYEIDGNKAAQLIVNAVKKDNCTLKHMNQMLFCASQNHDNRQCCTELGLADEQLEVGDHCLRMCDVRIREWRWNADEVQTRWESGRVTFEGQPKVIERLTKKDLVCLHNWNVVMFCHHRGLHSDWSKK